MPIWLRKFTFETLKEHYDKVNEESKKLENQNVTKNDNIPARPNIAPKQSTYTSKAPKK
jgi:hypothetical protein